MSPSCKCTKAKSLVNYSRGPLSCQMWGARSVELDIFLTLNCNNSARNQARS
uniref:SRCR domain-containing protein n=1 Tax=Mesocestoides corti TaxID=53468 RepID=A0A5K3FMD1_MESCO